VGGGFVKSSTKTALGIFGLIVLGVLASAGVFVFFGTQLAVYATVAIAPMLFIGGALWVRQRIQSTGTDQTQYTRRRAREVGEAFTDFWERHDQVRRTYPGVFGDGLGLGVNALIADLNEAGIQFDTQTGTFTLGSVSNLEEINTLANRIDEVQSDLDPAFGDAVAGRINAIQSELHRLDDLVDASQYPSGADVPRNHWTDAADEMDRAREQAIELIDDAAEGVQSAITAADNVDRASVEHYLADARDAAGNYQFSRAVTALLDARDAVRREGETTFSSVQQDLESLLATVTDSDADQYITDQSKTDVSDLQQSIGQLDDAIDLADLTRIRNDAKEQCINIVATLEEDLEGVIRQLEQADVPEGFYSTPEAADEDYPGTLRETEDLTLFETRWQTAVEKLTEALSTLEPKADVVSGYDNIREEIESQLRATGRVDGSDLPVRKHHEQFLGLYYREHPNEVTFDIDEPSLTVAGGGESYDVDVTVRFERGGPDRDVAVTLDGGATGPERTDTVTTPLVGTVTFTEVPFGEYTVRAEPADDEFASAEQSVMVDDQMEVDLDLSAISLRERICEGMEAEAERYLDDLEDTLAERFETEGQLTTEMSYRVDEEYIPCLLVLWADRVAHAVTESEDGAVVVYDAGTIRDELENVIRYNLDEGESITFDGLRERYLSAPVPDHELSEIATEELANVTVAETKLTKI
jgi:hypothetical protein